MSFYSNISFSYINSGLWETNCLNGQRKQQIYSDHQVSNIEYFYQDQNCTDLSFRFITDGLVRFDSAHSTFIDFEYTEIYLSLHKEVLVSDFNSREVCGRSDWTIHTSKKITGLRCALFNINNPTKIPKSGDQKFGIYKISSGELVYGRLTADRDGSTQLKRPVEFNETIIYRMKKPTEYTFQN